MPWLTLRGVILLAECEAEIEAARARYPRFDEIWIGITWLLACNPEPPGSFLSVERDGRKYFIYGFRGDADADIPDMWIFYEHNDQHVLVHGINANDAPRDTEADEA
jgi:hypothetical protein